MFVLWQKNNIVNLNVCGVAALTLALLKSKVPFFLGLEIVDAEVMIFFMLYDIVSYYKKLQ